MYDHKIDIKHGTLIPILRPPIPLIMWQSKAMDMKVETYGHQTFRKGRQKDVKKTCKNFVDAA